MNNDQKTPTKRYIFVKSQNVKDYLKVSERKKKKKKRFSTTRVRIRLASWFLSVKLRSGMTNSSVYKANACLGH